MSGLWPDEPPDEPLPYYAVGVCDECWRPAEELVEGLGECCRCHGCGDPAAPVELDERRLCMACAIDLGWTRPLELVLEAAGADLRDRDCECRRPVRTRSHLMDVVMTAASMGRVDAETLRRAAADRGVRHGGVAATEELAAEELAS